MYSICILMVELTAANEAEKTILPEDWRILYVLQATSSRIFYNLRLMHCLCEMGNELLLV